MAGDEFDSPPPSNRLYPDEGGISFGDVRNNPTDYSNQTPSVTQILEASTQIHLNHQVDNAGAYTYNKSIIYISGSNAEVTLSSNPQIAPSSQADLLTIQCADSSVTLVNGNGLRLYTSFLKLDSGSLVSFFYDAMGGLWCETSRMAPNYALMGEF